MKALVSALALMSFVAAVSVPAVAYAQDSTTKTTKKAKKHVAKKSAKKSKKKSATQS